MRIRFGDCTLDLDARQLQRSGRYVRLSPKAFDVLKLLVEERPRALSKGELLERAWQGIFVSDASLARIVTELRLAIGDSARAPALVRTVHAFGYAFSGEAFDEPPGAVQPSRCWLAGEHRRFALVQGEQIIGRDPDAAVPLDSPRVSRRHARVVVRGTLVTIEDLGSKNGTFVNGLRLEGSRELMRGETVRIGPFSLVLGIEGAAGPTETEVTRRDE